MLPWAIGAGKDNNQNVKNRERKDDQHVRAAEHALSKARDTLIAAQRDLASSVKELERSEDSRKSIATDIRKMKASLKDKFAATFKLDGALDSQKAAQESFDAVAGPLLQALYKSQEYQDSVKTAEEAQAEMRLLRQSTPADTAARDKKILELTRVARTPSELRKKALSGNTEAVSLHDKLDAARSKVSDIQEKVDDAIEKDSELIQLQKTLQSANDKADQAKTQVIKLRARIADAQGKVVQEQADWNRAKAQDKANDKPKKRWRNSP
jgi:chromosome segregation ATPase